MGAAASVNIDITALSAEDVAAYVGSLGPAFEEYKDDIVYHGLDGKVLSTLSDEEIDSFFDELHITKSIHRKKITIHLKDLKRRRISSASTEASIPTTTVALSLPIRSGKQTHLFFAYGSGEDGSKRDNPSRVFALHTALKALGFVTSFDGERNTDYCFDEENVELSLVMIACLTQDCLSNCLKIDSSDNHDGRDERSSCRLEIACGVEKLGHDNIVTVVMDPSMRDDQTWAEALGGALRVNPYVDLSDDFPENCVPQILISRLVAQIISRPNMAAAAVDEKEIDHTVVPAVVDEKTWDEKIIARAEREAAEFRVRSREEAAAEKEADDAKARVELDTIAAAEEEAAKIKKHAKQVVSGLRARSVSETAAGITARAEREAAELQEKAEQQAAERKAKWAALSSQRERYEKYYTENDIEGLISKMMGHILSAKPDNYIAYVIEYLKYKYQTRAKAAVIPGSKSDDETHNEVPSFICTATNEKGKVAEYCEFSGINAIFVRCVQKMIDVEATNPIAYIIEFMYEEYPDMAVYADSSKFDFALVTVCEAPEPDSTQEEIITEEGDISEENSIDELKKNIHDVEKSIRKLNSKKKKKKAMMNHWLTGFEEKHGRKPTDEDNEAIRDLYLDYKEVKKEIERLTLQEEQLKEALSNSIDSSVVRGRHATSLKSARDKLSLITHTRSSKVTLTPLITSFDEADD